MEQRIIMKHNPTSLPIYSRTFTAGVLMLSESAALVDLYLNLKDWNLVKKEAIENNVLHARAKSSSLRVVNEAVNRLRNLNEAQLTIFDIADKSTKQHLLWYAICKTFPLISDFAEEVLHDKYTKLETKLTMEDINVFFMKKAGWHDDLENKSLSTKIKMKQVLFHMLKEAELIDNNNNVILPAFFSKDFLSCMPFSNQWHLLYPTQTPVMEYVK